MPAHRKAAAVLAAGVLAATAVTGAAATASAAPSSSTPNASSSVAAACQWRTGVGFYCGYHLANTYSDYGDQGNKVKEIQANLRWRGYDIGRYGVDGKFGKDTRSAVKKFQRNWGLDDDGIVGPKTWQVLRTGV